MTIPNVFVVPPEEDHSPAWCYFDAAQRHLNSTLILVDSDDRGECNKFEHDMIFPQSSLYRDVADDSDVIEIVKVGRCALEDEPAIQAEQGPTDFTRPTTLKLRASRMFHSLKNVGKRKRNTDTSTTLPRRKSALLSQLFSVPTGPKAHSPSSYLQDSTGPYSTHPEPNVSNSNCHSEPRECVIEETDTTVPSRSASPSPSFRAKRRFSKINLQKMFSFVTTSPLENTAHPTVSNGLGRSGSEDAEQARSTSVSSVSDRIASFDSNGLDSSDDVPSSTLCYAILSRQPPAKGIDDENAMLVEHPSLAAELSLNLGTDLDLNLDPPVSAIHPPQVAGIPPTSSSTHMNMDGGMLGDISFEMHLNSLHFDDLSFDVNRF